MMTTQEAFLEKVKVYAREHSAFLHHPFARRLLNGEASREELKGFALQFWVIPKTHLVNNAGKLAHATLQRGGWLDQLLGSSYDPELIELLGGAVADEMGKTAISPENHYHCYFNLTDALGIPREMVGRPETLLPETLVAMHTWATTALQFSLLELIASHNLVNDAVNVVAYPRFCEALMNHYGLSREAVRWFDLHGEVDQEHNAMSTRVLTKLIQGPEDERLVWQAVKLGLGVKWAIFDAVQHAYVDGSWVQEGAQ